MTKPTQDDASTVQRVKAAVFDMDGTLVDNMRFHADAWLEMVRRLARMPNLSDTARERLAGVTAEKFETGYAGKKNDEIFPELLDRIMQAEELARLADEKEQLYRDLATPHLVEMPGLRAFLDGLRARGIALAVATAAPPTNRALVLEKLRLDGVFAHIVGAEDAPRGKPHPDLYLAAARRLGIAPEDCVAFEDAPNGVRAAVAAGMRCAGVVTTTAAPKLVEVGAFCTFTRFDDVPAALTALF